jgi:hypothetical protein
MTLSYHITPASFIVSRNDEPILIPSMVLSTILVVALLTAFPWLAPVLMADVQKSAV